MDGRQPEPAVVAEWLRRWTWNPMGFPRAGSNPAGCELQILLVSSVLFIFFLQNQKVTLQLTWPSWYSVKIRLLSGVGFEPTQSYDYESLNLTP